LQFFTFVAKISTKSFEERRRRRGGDRRAEEAKGGERRGEETEEETEEPTEAETEAEEGQRRREDDSSMKPDCVGASSYAKAQGRAIKVTRSSNVTGAEPRTESQRTVVDAACCLRFLSYDVSEFCRQCDAPACTRECWCGCDGGVPCYQGPAVARCAEVARQIQLSRDLSVPYSQGPAVLRCTEVCMQFQLYT
jgi:hypothetical protein